ncbi:MAG: glycerol-3-phosphate acyltransferase [Actinomycetota bacterium]|nr:glycerol-3-phosphate acyltransferase [Actinomycetota bacterium]
MMINFLCLVLGYLIGSISPSYFLGKILAGIDIRKVHLKDAGVSNTYYILGVWPAVVVALFDLSKGILSILLAYGLGANFLFANLAGFCAILGHLFPFYLNFNKGGWGLSTSVGLLFMYLFILVEYISLSPYPLIILGLMVLALVCMGAKGEMIGLSALPLLVLIILSEAPLNPFSVFAILLISYIFWVNTIVKYDRILEVKKKFEDVKTWRILLRPGAPLFLLFYDLFGKTFGLTLVGGLVIVFLTVDILRLGIKRINLFLFKNLFFAFKEKERVQFSSMTLFLIGAFLTFLLFERNIAFAALVFLIFGDIFAKIFGILYGKHRIFDGKNVEGLLGYFLASLLAGYLLLPYVNLLFWVIALGSLAAAVAEVLPLPNDNFSVPLISAASMLVTKIF